MDTNENKKKKSFRPIFLAILIIVIGIAVFFRLNYKPEEAVMSTPVVETMTLGKGDIYSEVSVTGTILPVDTYAVVCKVNTGGEVKKIYVKNGDYVKAGDPICEIDNQKQIDAAYITYDAAKKAYNRISVLYSRGDVSRQNYEQVKAQYDGAKLAYDTQVEFATPTATGDGYVQNTNMTEGLGVDYKAILCYITSDKGTDIQFGVTERAIKGINIGDSVVVEKSGEKYDGAKLAYDTQVEFATPTATGDGYVQNTNMTEGLGVDYKAILCYITSDKGTDIQFGVTERAIKGINIGDSVVVEKSGEKYEATVYDKASLISQNTGLFNIKAKIEGNHDFAQGIMAKVTAIYDERLNTNIIPRSVIYYENEKPLLYYLDVDSRVRIANLTLGLETDEEVEVLAGINENTKIISTWHSDLVDGTEVKEMNTHKYIVKKKVGRKHKDIIKKEVVATKSIATKSEIEDKKINIDKKKSNKK